MVINLLGINGKNLTELNIDNSSKFVKIISESDFVTYDLANL
jgi:hypothetical protein